VPYLLNVLPGLLVVVALIVLGVVFGPRAGAARGRMWAGIGVLTLAEVTSVVWSLLFPYLYDLVESAAGYGVLASVYGVARTVVYLVGVALLVSAVALGRQETVGYSPDPNRPGAPPTGYGSPPPQPGPGSPSPPGDSPYIR
jgi:hypothetical protein